MDRNAPIRARVIAAAAGRTPAELAAAALEAHFAIRAVSRTDDRPEQLARATTRCDEWERIAAHVTATGAATYNPTTDPAAKQVLDEVALAAAEAEAAAAAAPPAPPSWRERARRRGNPQS